MAPKIMIMSPLAKPVTNAIAQLRQMACRDAAEK